MRTLIRGATIIIMDAQGDLPTLANIDSVMVAGRWKKRGGRLLDVELARQLADMRWSGEKITQALGLLG